MMNYFILSSMSSPRSAAKLVLARRSITNFLFENPKKSEKDPNGEIATTLPMTLPDLNELESKYIQSQLDYFGTLNQDHLTRCNWERAEFLVKEKYPRFLQGKVKKPSDRLYKHFTKSTILTQRTVRAMHDLGITSNEVMENPTLFSYSLTSLPRDAEAKRFLDVPLIQVLKQRKIMPLRGFQLRSLTNDLFDTLQKLELTEHGLAIESLMFAPKDGGSISLDEFNRRAILLFVKNTFPEDFVPQALEVLKANRNITDSAKNINKNVAAVPAISAKWFIRNYWLFYQLLGDKVFTRKMFRYLSLYSCPLESIITLNDCYNTLTKHEPMSLPDFREFFAKNGIHHLIQPSLKLPISLRMTLLREIGFSESEATQILMSKNKSFSEVRVKDKPRVDQLRYGSPFYIETMKKRLELLRSNANTLGISNMPDIFCAMTNWPNLLESIQMICENKLHAHCLHFVGNQSGIKIQTTLEYRSASCHPALLHLIKFFECETPEEKAKLKSDSFLYSNQRAIPLSRILQTLDFLLENGFTKSQIRRATPLLFYPVSLIEQKLYEMKHEMPEEFAASDWDRERSSDSILQCCLYLLEKEFHFTSDGYWSGMRMDFSQGLYQELQNHLGYKEQLAKKQLSSAPQTIKTEQKHRSAKSALSNRSSSTGSLNRPLHLEQPQQQPRHHRLQQHQPNFMVGARQIHSSCYIERPRTFVLQNPFKALRIHGEFLKLKSEWDPDMDKKQFLEGAKQAVVTVTQLIKESNYDGLIGLLSRRERKRLRNEIETKWSDVMKNNISLEMDEVTAAVPERVFQHNVAYQRFCDIDVTFVAVKLNNPVPINISVTFHRDYTDGRLPDWVIRKFRVLNEMESE